MPGGDALAVEVRAGGSLRCSWAGAVLLGCPRERRGGCWVARERSGPGERRKGSGLGRSRVWAGFGFPIFWFFLFPFFSNFIQTN